MVERYSGLAESTRVAKELAEAETRRREAKTARLKAARLARDTSAPTTPSKPVEKSKS